MRQKPRHLEFPALRFIQQRHDVQSPAVAAAATSAAAVADGRDWPAGLALAGRQSRPPACSAITRGRWPPRSCSTRSRTCSIGTKTRPAIGSGPRNGPLDAAAVARGKPGWRARRPHRRAGVPGRSAARPSSASGGWTPRQGRSAVCRLLESAAELLTKSDLRREIYVFTDLAARRLVARSRRPGSRSALQELHGASLYLIDVGVEKPQDYGLGEVRLSSQVLGPQHAAGESSTDMSAVGATGEARGRDVSAQSVQGGAERAVARPCRSARERPRRLSSRSRPWIKGRGRAICGSSAKTDWRPTTSVISRPKSGRPWKCSWRRRNPPRSRPCI